MSETNKGYHLKMKFNGKEFEFYTQDLRKSIMAVKPALALKTNVFFYCKSPDGKVCDKMVPSKRARMFWRNSTYMDVFINQLIFKNV